MAALVNPTKEPIVAFAWDLPQIGTYLDDVQKNPTKYCANPKYSKPNSDGKETRIHVVAAAEFIKKCSTAKPPQIFDANLAGIGVDFEGVELPDNTVFDVLGWLLSVCSEPPANATDRAYYLPLLSLFARWCRLLSGSIAITPPMVHISWFKGAGGKMLVLLGSTIGSIESPLRQGTVEQERQHELIEDGFKPRDGQLVNFTKDAAHPNPIVIRSGKVVDKVFKLDPLENEEEWVKSGAGFGLCAETFFYLVAKRLGKAIINEKTVKGLALRPRAIGSKKVSKFQELIKYDEVAAAESLADPCAVSCQFLIPQLGTLQNEAAWKWQDIFDVSKLQEEITPGSSKAAKAAAGSSGTPAASTSAAAGGNQAKSTFGGEMGKVALSTLPGLMKTPKKT